MKKRFSGLTVGIIAFLMLATGVAAGGYINWGGSDNFKDSMNTMDKIEHGIKLLRGDLTDERSSHEETTNKLVATENELNELKGKIAEAVPGEGTDIQDLINDRNTLKSDLATMTSDRDKLQGNLDLIAFETSKYVTNLNNTNGVGPKYKYLVDNVNPNLKHLYSMGGIEAGPTVSSTPGNGPKDNQLEQAIKDMEEVKGKSDSTFGAFDEETQKRIEDDLKDEDN